MYVHEYIHDSSHHNGRPLAGNHVFNRLPPEAYQYPAGGAPVPPYYPDTKVVRNTIAIVYTQITLLDPEVEKLVAQLKEDGLINYTERNLEHL